MLNRSAMRILTPTICVCVCLQVGVLRTRAADETQLPASQKLRNDQEAVSGRYARFERLLSQMADMLGHEDPERAELLRRAISKGRERAIGSELDAIARTLGDGDFGTAREKQVGITKSLEALLKLLQSEDRRSSVEKERERLNNLLKDVRNTIAEERAARGAAQNSNAPSSAAPAQQQAMNKTDQILKEVDDHDQQSGEESSDGADSEEQSDKKDRDGESPKGEGEESQGETKDGDKPEADKSDGEKGANDTPKAPKENEGQSEDSPSEKGQPSEGDPSGEKSDPKKPSEQSSGGSESPSGQSKPGDSSESSSGSPQDSQQDKKEQTPGRQQLEDARKKMQEALDQLKEQERDKAVDSQDEAITQLQKAAAELEKTLKQLREEEKEMVLAALEARFQRLLALQTQIYETTVDLSSTPRKEWLDTIISQCRELSQQQADLTRECSQTTGLLREDGTSVSILVAVEDIESDMGSISSRLQQTKVATLTQSMETDVIEALKELIEATQREMEEMKSEQKKQSQQMSSNQDKPPLVELMAEIRVLRSLQMRVNRRTKQVHDLLQEGDSADVADLTDQLEELAIRQNRLRDSAAELAAQLEKKR